VPARNRIKNYRPNATYHVYGRSLLRRRIFARESDRREFLDLLRDRLERSPGNRKVEVVAFALMPNHFHLILHQVGDPNAISQLMGPLLSSFARRYNQRNNRSGPLFERPFKARRVTGSLDLLGLVAYVHLNPHKRFRDTHSSHPVFEGRVRSSWVATARGLRPFGGTAGYSAFMASSEAVHSARRAAGMVAW
jgi:REP element-mobilizing transposase RayT